jgi:hypothetical protein
MSQTCQERTHAQRDARAARVARPFKRMFGCRLDPLSNVRFIEHVLRSQKLDDFYQSAMDDRIVNSGTEKGGLELLPLLEVLRPIAARLGKSKIGVRGHAPGRLEHRVDLGHETGLRRRKRIRFCRHLSQHSLQQSGLLGRGRHALTVDRIEPAKRISDRQHPAGQAGKPLEVPPIAGGKAVVPDAS